MLNTGDIFNASILIVDDQQMNVQLLEQMLREEGYQHITTTTDPHAVCALHRDNRYDLILLDLVMPDKDGFQVMDELKELKTGSYLPILVITAKPDHKLRALQSGAKDFVSKPFDLVEVKTRIYNMIEVRLLYQALYDANKVLEQYNEMLSQTVLEKTAELRASEERFRRLTELSSDWYWEQDEEGNFTKVYGPALEMLEPPGQNAPVETREDQGVLWRETQKNVLQANLATRQPFLDLVYSRTKADGSQQYLMVSGEPKFDSTGRFTGYRGIGKDVTELMHRNAEPDAA
ncbi:MAG: response regulator [Gallionella sp.]|nr:response regulator [Gallionella sp.]